MASVCGANVWKRTANSDSKPTGATKRAETRLVADDEDEDDEDDDDADDDDDDEEDDDDDDA